MSNPETTPCHFCGVRLSGPEGFGCACTVCTGCEEIAPECLCVEADEEAEGAP